MGNPSNVPDAEINAARAAARLLRVPKDDRHLHEGWREPDDHYNALPSWISTAPGFAGWLFHDGLLATMEPVFGAPDHAGEDASLCFEFQNSELRVRARFSRAGEATRWMWQAEDAFGSEEEAFPKFFEELMGALALSLRRLPPELAANPWARSLHEARDLRLGIVDPVIGLKGPARI